MDDSEERTPTPPLYQQPDEPPATDVTRWPPGEPALPFDAESPSAKDGIRWIEVDAAPRQSREVLEAVAPICGPELTLEMIADLLTPDREPEGKTYQGTDIRLASSCRIEARSHGNAKTASTEDVGGDLTIQPIEMLAGADWLITCWHDAQLFKGGQFTEMDADLDSYRDELQEAVKRRWGKRHGRTAADLGTLILHELVLGYGEAEHTLDMWLEHWELAHHQSVIEYSELTAKDRIQDLGRRAAALRQQHAQLTELSGAIAVLRSWITPQNRVGLKEDPYRAWLIPADTDLVCEVDDRIDSALADLHELSQALRSSFSLLQFQQLEAQRDRREQLMRRIEIVAAAFLIPTLVVGFYGANTWVPGQQEHWGFWIMLVVILLLSLVGAAGVWIYQARQARSLDELGRQTE